MRMNAGANLHTIELVKEVKDCLGKLEIQRQIDTQRGPSSVGHRLPRSVSEGRLDRYLSEMGLLGQVPKFLTSIWVYLSSI